MKAIMISIKPKWCAKIMNGEKTIEIRKTMPKCDLPIDVYIYCTKDDDLGRINDFPNKYFVDCVETPQDFEKMDSAYNGKGKVVAKFTLNKVEEINRYCAGKGISYKTETLNDIELCDKSCLDIIEIDHYLYFKKGYAWHISNLIIFDKPKELSEFRKCYRSKGYPQNQSWQLTKAPQNYCYIETGN